jgi:hypothetical protein
MGILTLLNFVILGAHGYYDAMWWCVLTYLLLTIIKLLRK